MAVTHYRELIAWQRAMDLVVPVYELTRSFPKEEMYGLTSQIRRAAVSVPANIAEGQGRGAGHDFARFLRIANGSRQELETEILVAVRLGYVLEADAQDLLSQSHEVGRLVSGLHRSIVRDCGDGH